MNPRYLDQEQFEQLVTRPTHIKGGEKIQITQNNDMALGPS